LQIGLGRLRNITLLVLDAPLVDHDMVIGSAYLKFRRTVLSMPDRRIYLDGSLPKVPSDGSTAPPGDIKVTRPERASSMI
jgi:hypothetical protein